MAKRISKKLLVGLGSVVTFGAVGTVSGFGIKSIIDSATNYNQNNQLTVNQLAETDFQNISNYNTADQNMFINTTNLKRFHFGNVQTGQKVTPWGWLGVFDDSATVRTRIALTGWNGEIIWINEDYKNDANYNVYDMQYDWNTDRLFVLRTSSENGLQDGNANVANMQLDILDAKTGRSVSNSKVDSNWFRPFETAANAEIKKKFVQSNSEYNKKRSRNLYYLDVAYASKQKASLVTWMPNFMHLADHNKKSTDNAVNKATLTLPTLEDVTLGWDKLAVSVLLNNSLIEQNNPANYKRQFKLFQTSGRPTGIFKTNNDNVILKIGEDGTNGINGINGDKLYMLINPFFTVGDDNNSFIIHLLMAEVNTTGSGKDQRHETKKIYHKTIGFSVDYGGSANTSGTVVEKYTQLESWSNNGFFELEGNASWAKSLGWNLNALNAYLRPTKNMFNQNSIVVPYPFGVSSHMNYGNWFPIFNVAQLKINPSTGKIDTGTKESDYTSSINYNFGTQIKKYFDQYGSKYNSTQYNNIQPYPGNNDASSNYNHLYNRLISVSPFDNTIIYAAKPNIRENIFDQTSNNVDKWAGFWIANSWAIKQTKGKYYRPLIVSADPSIRPGDTFNNDASRYMLMNVNDLYANGFAFDIRSLVDINGQKSLNLYFNQSGRGVNDSYGGANGFKSSKIGILDDVLKVAPASDNNSEIVWVKNIANKYGNANTNRAKELLATGITKKSYASIIHSRADLTKWYTRTWNNINNPLNMYPRMTQLNGSANTNTRAIATKFGSKLEGAEFNSNQSIDLVSSWKDIDNTLPPNYSRLIVQRPIITTGLDSDPNNLGLVTKYEMPKPISDLVTTKPGWGFSKDTARLTLTNVQTARNASVQILSSWKDSYKMAKAPRTTEELGELSKINWEELKTPEWLDRRSSPNIQFGNSNNNVPKNGVIYPLRLTLKLIKPSGNLPAWFNSKNFPDDKFFDKAYPIESSYAGETTFKDIIKEFSNQKAKFIDLSDSKNVNTAIGIGNFKVDAYLELNPKFASYGDKDKFYTITTTGAQLQGSKIIVDKNTNQAIIYKDDFNDARTIYDQSQIEYDKFQEGGFGKDGSQLRQTIQQSWKDNIFNGNRIFNIKATTDYDNLNDTLVRVDKTNTNPTFSFAYKQGDKSKIEITPTNRTWFESHFQHFNRLLNLFVQFEYSTATSGDTWTSLGSFLTDKVVKDKTNVKTGVLTLDAPNSSIKRIRYRLTPKADTDTDPNLSVNVVNFRRDDKKYVSDIVSLSIQTITVDKNWITSATLSNNTSSLIDLVENDVTNFENSVLNNIRDQDERSAIKLVYSFENSGFTLSADQLVAKIKEKFNNFNDNNQHGVFALWNGNTGRKLIKAKFVVRDSNSGIQLVTNNNSSPSEGDLSSDVKSTIKSKIDLTDYISQLTNSKITARMGNTPGTIQTNSINIPNKTNQGRFQNKSLMILKIF